jgi:GNAT superfamily N-acetyltransferase
VDFADWEAELDRVHGLLNAGLAHLPDHIGWEREALASLLAPFRQIADPELILIAEEGDDVIGWLAGIPNLNEAFIQVDGLRRPWEYLKLWFFMRRQPECLALKSVIVLPPYWNRGVGILLFNEMARRAISKGYRWADLSLTSADNPHTPMLAEHIGASIYKRYRVYRRVV